MWKFISRMLLVSIYLSFFNWPPPRWMWRYMLGDLNSKVGYGIFDVAVVWSLSRVWLFCSPTDCSPPGSSVHGRRGMLLALPSFLGCLVPYRTAVSFQPGPSLDRSALQEITCWDKCAPVTWTTTSSCCFSVRVGTSDDSWRKTTFWHRSFQGFHFN